MQRQKEELKNQIITLLNDVFSFGFHYYEETDEFISNCNDYDEYADIYVSKEGIDLNIGCKNCYDSGCSHSNYIYIDKLIELTNCLKNFYK